MSNRFETDYKKYPITNYQSGGTKNRNYRSSQSDLSNTFQSHTTKVRPVHFNYNSMDSGIPFRGLSRSIGFVDNSSNRFTSDVLDYKTKISSIFHSNSEKLRSQVSSIIETKQNVFTFQNVKTGEKYRVTTVPIGFYKNMLFTWSWIKSAGLYYDVRETILDLEQHVKTVKLFNKMGINDLDITTEEGKKVMDYVVDVATYFLKGVGIFTITLNGPIPNPEFRDMEGSMEFHIVTAFSTL